MENKFISVTKDNIFADKMTCFVVARLINVFVLPFFKVNEALTMDKLEEVLRKNTDDRTSFIKSLMCYNMLLMMSK